MDWSPQALQTNGNFLLKFQISFRINGRWNRQWNRFVKLYKLVEIFFQISQATMDKFVIFIW